MTRVGGWVARGAAGFAGLALWLDVARAFAGRGRPAEWWLSFYGAPWAAAAWTLAAAALLTAFSLWPTAPEWRRRATLSVLAVGAAVAVWDGVSFYRVLASGTVRSSWPVPLSVFVAVGLLLLFRSVHRGVPAALEGRTARVAYVSGFAGTAIVLAVGQMVCFGATDYRRDADAVVVLGARVYADGTPSLALADRVRTASRLMLEKRAPLLIVSGGPGDGGAHETDAMRTLAIEMGVPASAIVVDRDGIDTDHTADDTARILHQRLPASDARPTVLAVSHGYHLPRVKLALEGAGLTAYTVPAKETRTLVRLPLYMAREVIAFWAYTLRTTLPRVTEVRPPPESRGPRRSGSS
ncbi:MAG: YdcF family protein [Myxococcales bacterium]|nr:YdcF family protein [Myxococcales bacterium]MCB9582600.1 YdcF family protein [Polyangiaceae bacterium]